MSKVKNVAKLDVVPISLQRKCRSPASFGLCSLGYPVQRRWSGQRDCRRRAGSVIWT